jgi:hypothetical protein
VFVEVLDGVEVAADDGAAGVAQGGRGDVHMDAIDEIGKDGV